MHISSTLYTQINDGLKLIEEEKLGTRAEIQCLKASNELVRVDDLIYDEVDRAKLKHLYAIFRFARHILCAHFLKNLLVHTSGAKRTTVPWTFKLYKKKSDIHFIVPPPLIISLVVTPHVAYQMRKARNQNIIAIVKTTTSRDPDQIKAWLPKIKTFCLFRTTAAHS